MGLPVFYSLLHESFLCHLKVSRVFCTFIRTFKCFLKRHGKLSGFSLKQNSNMDRVFLSYKD